jgi:hypothetical protein
MNFERVAPIAGIVFFVLGLAATLLTIIDSPDFDATGEEILPYYEDEAGRLLLGVFLYGLASFAFVFFLVGFRQLLRVAEGATGWLSNVALVAGVAAVAVLTASNAPTFAAALRGDDEELSTDAAQTLFDLGGALYVFALPPMAAFAVAAGVLIARTGAFARWLGWVGVVIGITLLVPFIAWATFVLLVIWVLVISLIWMLRGRAPAPPPPPGV